MFQLNEPYTILGETYTSNELIFCSDTLIRETDILDIKSAVLDKLTESGDLFYSKLITEDVNKIRTNLSNALKRLVELITNLTRKFQHIAATLTARNAEWVKAAKTKVTNETVPANFSFEIYPYHTARQKLLTYQIPTFQESNQEFLASLESDSTFKEKYFKDLYVTSEGKKVYDPKTVFRGGSEQVKINKSFLLQNIEGMMNFIEGYSANAKKIIDQNNKILDILKKAETKVKTAPLSESANIILETINILLENEDATKPATTQTIENEKSENPTSSSNTSKGPTVKDTTTGVKIYTTACYGVNSVRMGIMEESYNAYVKLISSAIASTKKKEQESD